MNTIDTNLQLRYSTPSEDLRPTLLLQRSLQLLNGVLREFAAYKMLTGVKTMTQVPVILIGLNLYLMIFDSS